jgi:hypothetical protein
VPASPERRPWYRDILDEVWKSKLVWAIEAAVIAIGTAVAAVAKQQWQVSPVASGTIIAGVAVLVVAVPLVWYGRDQWSASIKHKRDVRSLVRQLREEAEAAAHLLGSVPIPDDPAPRHIAWAQSSHDLLRRTETWARSQTLPRHVAGHIGSPSKRPGGEEFRGTQYGDVRYQLALALAGLDEAATLYAKEEGV